MKKHPILSAVALACSLAFAVPAVSYAEPFNLVIDNEYSEEGASEGDGIVGNTVTIKEGANLTKQFNGAYNFDTSDTFRDITLNIEGGTTKQIKAAKTYSGSADGVTVNITGGTVNYSGQAVIGFEAGSNPGNVAKNINVNVSGGTVNGDVIGANNVGDADGVKISVTGGNLQNVIGVRFSVGTVQNTLVEIGGDAKLVSSSYGLNVASVSTTSKGTIKNNTLRITGGEIKSVNSQGNPNGFVSAVMLDGFKTGTLDIEGNRLEILGGKIDVAEINGVRIDKTYAATAKNSEVLISGGEVKANIITGTMLYAEKKSVDKSAVTITGGTITAQKIYGAYSTTGVYSGASTVGESVVNISGGEFIGNGVDLVEVGGFSQYRTQTIEDEEGNKETIELAPQILATQTTVNLDGTQQENGLDLEAVKIVRGHAEAGELNVTGDVTSVNSVADMDVVNIADDSSINVANSMTGVASLSIGANSSVEAKEITAADESSPISMYLADTESNREDGKKIKATVKGKVALTGGGAILDQAESSEAAIQATLDALDFGSASVAETLESMSITNGNVGGDITDIVINKDGTFTYKESKNDKLEAYRSVHSLGAIQWRHEMNDLTKRMGELRDSSGTIGAWARLYGSEMEYGSQNILTKNTTIQVGADYDVGYGWKVGGAFGYTDGSAQYDNGEADNKIYSLAAYGTWLSEDGQFVDLIAKYSRIENDFALGNMAGSSDNNAYNISAEYGWHFVFAERAFIEPQVELTYGQVLGDDIVTSNSVLIEQKDYDSFIGRLGLRVGFKFPENKGNVYARASVLHDFMGKTESKASAIGGKRVETLKDDLGGTWYEYGVGANFNWSDNTYVYVDFERSASGEVRENYRWNIGLRHAF